LTRCASWGGATSRRSIYPGGEGSWTAGSAALYAPFVAALIVGCKPIVEIARDLNLLVAVVVVIVGVGGLLLVRNLLLRVLILIVCLIVAAYIAGYLGTIDLSI
jgi:hypothetical protein